MAVAYDASSGSHTGTAGNTGSPDPFTWTHAGTASARGALVLVFTIASAGQDAGVTYGGTTMNAVPYTAAQTDGEVGFVRAYYLDNVSTGSQTVSVDRTGSSIMYAICYTFTAGAATEVYEAGVHTKAGTSADNTGASSSGTGTTSGWPATLDVDDGSPGTNSVRVLGYFTGVLSLQGAGTTNCTIGPGIDLGSYVCNSYYESTAGQGSRTVGAASTSINDDVAAIGVAVREAAASNVTATPGTLSLTTTAYAPTVTASDHKTATPDTAALTLTTYAPVVTATTGSAVTVTPDTASLNLTAFAPSVIVSDHKLVTPATAALTLTTYAPGVTGGAGVTVVPGPLALTITTYAPAVTTSNNIRVVPGPLALTITTYAPVVTVPNPIVVTPATATLTLTGYAPTVGNVIYVGGLPPAGSASRVPPSGRAAYAVPAGGATHV